MSEAAAQDPRGNAPRQGAVPPSLPANSSQATPVASPEQGQKVQPGEKPTQRQTPPRTPEEEMRALLQDLTQAADGLSGRNSMLQFTVARLNVAAVANPAVLMQEGFRREVAYAVQDIERATDRKIMPSTQFGNELQHAAISIPNLKNYNVEQLLEATPAIRDQGLVQDIRTVAQAMAKAGDAQSAPSFKSTVEALENRYRHQATPSVPGATPTRATVATDASSPPENGRAARSDGAPQGAQGRESIAEQGTLGASRQVAGARANAAVQGAHPKGSAVIDIMKRLRAPAPTGAETIYPPVAHSVADRLSKFEARIAEGRTQGLIENAEKSGVQALLAMEQFTQGPGRGILGKIEAAASTEPGGMQTVMKEMQPGGRYANLRTEFDNAYQQEQIFRGAYDNMIDCTARFGRDRQAVTDNFTQRSLDPNQLAGRFQRAEEALGENLAKTPGKQPGKSALDEIGEKLGEILRTAVDRVKEFFRPGTTVEQAQQPSPGPSAAP